MKKGRRIGDLFYDQSTILLNCASTHTVNNIAKAPQMKPDTTWLLSTVLNG